MAAVTHTSVGSGESLVSTPNAGTVTNKSLLGEGGVTLSSTSTEITVSTSQPFCFVQQSSPPTITNGSVSTLSWNTIVNNSFSMYSAGSPTIITISEQGWYVIQASLYFTCAGGVNGQVYIEIDANNGSNFVVGSNSVYCTASGVGYVANICTGFFMGNGDYFFVKIGNNSGVTLTPSYIQYIAPSFRVFRN